MTPRKRKLAVWAAALAALVVLYALLGFFVLPRVARTQLTQRATVALKRDVSIATIRFNPFTFAATLEGLRVADSGDAPLATLESGRINFDPWESLIRWQWRFGEIVLTAPEARLVIDEQGRLNIADLIEPSKPTGEGPPSLGVDQLTVARGQFHFSDRSGAQPFTSHIAPIGFTLSDFSTAAGAAGEYRLTGNTEAGGTFSWNGTLSAAPFASRGQVRFEQLQLPNYMPLLASFIQGQVQSGLLTIVGRYDASFGENRHATLSEFTLQLANLAVAAKGAETPAVTVPELVVEMPEAQLLDGTARVTTVSINGPTVRARRDASGKFDVVTLFTPPAAGDSATRQQKGGQQKGGESEPFKLNVETIALQNGTLVYIDATVPEPLEVQADQVQVTAKGVSTDLAREIEIELALRWAGGPGTLAAKGTVQPKPLSASLELKGKQLELSPVAPFLRQALDFEVVSGSATIDGRISARMPDTGQPSVEWKGSIAIDSFASRAPSTGEDLIAWSRLELSETEFTPDPQRFSAQRIHLQQPRVLVVLRKDGTFNLAAVFAEEKSDSSREPPPGPPQEQPATESGLPLELAVQEVALEGGRIAFRDQSISPEFSADLTELAGTLRGLSTQADTTAEVTLTAALPGSAPLTLKGKLNALGPEFFSGSDVALDMSQLRLELFESYARRYLGYRIRQGQLRGDFSYVIEGAQLDGSNHVVLDEFFLGESVESPDALSVPVKFAMSVLRNSQGQIVLDVPVSGSLESPEFSFANALQSAFRNAVVKAATAPFSILASLIGVDEADLSQAEFPPGNAQITEATRQRFDALARALKERPALEVKINWHPAPEIDRESLRRERLENLIAEEQNRLRSAASAATVTDVTTEEAIRSLFRERFPESAPAVPPVADTAPAEEPEKDRPNAVVRFFRWLFGGDDRAVAAAPPPPPDEAPAPETGPSVEEQRQRLLESVTVSEDAYATLAQERARAARQQLIEHGVDASRIVIADQPTAPQKTDVAGGKAAVVSFELQETTPDLAAAAEPRRGSGR